MVASTYGGFRALSMHSHLRKYPVYFSIDEVIPVEEARKVNTNDLAGSLRKKIDSKVDYFRGLDIKYFEESKLSNKRKELETKVDIRAKA